MRPAITFYDIRTFFFGSIVNYFFFFNESGNFVIGSGSLIIGSGCLIIGNLVIGNLVIGNLVIGEFIFGIFFYRRGSAVTVGSPLIKGNVTGIILIFGVFFIIV